MIHIPSPPSPASGPFCIPAPPPPVFVTPFADVPLPPPPGPPTAVGLPGPYGFSPAPPPPKSPVGPTAVFHAEVEGQKQELVQQMRGMVVLLHH